MLRSTDFWRGFLLILAGLALLATGRVLWQLAYANGHVGVTLPQGYAGPITVAPDSAAYRAGARTGDVIDGRTLSNGARYRLWEDDYLAGDTLQLPIRTSAGLHVIDVVAARMPPQRVGFVVAVAVDVWAILFGALLAWRRSGSPDARILALLLIVALGLVNLRYIVTPWPSFDLSLSVISAFTTVALGLLATYAVLYPVKHAVVQRALAYAAYGAGLITAFLDAAGSLAVWFGAHSPQSVTDRLAAAGYAATFLLAFSCAIVTACEARDEQRTRIVWVAVSFTPMYILGFLYLAVFAFGHYSEELHNAVDVGYVIATIGLWCALLNRRALDLGFIINRAAVFTGVSVLLLGTFVLVEWLLAEWLQGMNRSANIIISALVALALGLSIRFVHNLVDRVVDRIFFRKRHEDENAIRRFAQEAPYVTDAALLRERTIATLQRHTDASSVKLFCDDGDGTYGGVSENDPAIVRLRATRQIVELHDTESALGSELAFPMVARGRLIGIIALGPRRSGEAYAPDESNAIAQLAHSVAGALDILALKQSDSQPEQAFLARIDAGFADLSRQIASLVQNIGHAD